MQLLKPKGSGHTAFTEQARSDWQRVIMLHPERFDALLHRAIIKAAEEDTSGANFSNVNERVSDISYADPVIVSAVESNGDDEYFSASQEGDESMGTGETMTMIARISDFDVPEGSIIEFLVSLAGGDLQRQFWYVHRSVAVGSPAIGILHYCIPCGDIEQMTIPDITETVTDTVTETVTETVTKTVASTIVADAEQSSSGALFGTM